MRDTTLTCCSKLCVYTFSHDTLQSEACTHETYCHKSEGIRPSWIAPYFCDTPLSAFPRTERRCHGEEGLNDRPEAKPGARFGTHLVAYSAKRCTSDESQHGGEGLLIRNVESGVAVPWRPGKQSCEGKGKLQQG